MSRAADVRGVLARGICDPTRAAGGVRRTSAIRAIQRWRHARLSPLLDGSYGGVLLGDTVPPAMVAPTGFVHWWDTFVSPWISLSTAPLLYNAPSLDDLWPSDAKRVDRRIDRPR